MHLLAMQGKLKHGLAPPRVAKCYSLDDITAGGYACAKAKKAWCGLKQSGKIAHDGLAAGLEKRGYAKPGLAGGLLGRKARGISFALAAGGFGTKHKREEGLQHLAEAMRAKRPPCALKAGAKAEQCAGTHLGWGYEKGELTASMKGYAKQALSLIHI